MTGASMVPPPPGDSPHQFAASGADCATTPQFATVRLTTVSESHPVRSRNSQSHPSPDSQQLLGSLNECMDRKPSAAPLDNSPK